MLLLFQALYYPGKLPNGLNKLKSYVPEYSCIQAYLERKIELEG